MLGVMLGFMLGHMLGSMLGYDLYDACYDFLGPPRTLASHKIYNRRNKLLGSWLDRL